MVLYIITGILIIIVLIIIALILRKRIYDKVDYFESWKMDIMNRNIASELSKIKNLNLSGETQRKFESWRDRWESIVAKELADIEEYLYDAEESADYYRFPSANKTLLVIEESLHNIEEDLEKMLVELDDLLDAEKESREEVIGLDEKITELKTTLSQRRYQFGGAETYFEVEIDELEKLLQKYDEFVEEGEYTKAKEHVEEVRVQLESLVSEMEQFPKAYKKCKDELPVQLAELLAGIKGMIEDGYRIKHLQFEKEIQQYQERLIDCVQALEKGDISEVVNIIPEIDERILEMYKTLEQEAIDKNYIDTQLPSFEQTMTELASAFASTKSEVEQLKTTYYFEDKYMEKYLALEKSVNQISNQFHDFSTQLSEDDMSHTDLRGLLENGFDQLKALHEEHKEFKKRIQNLRKDELTAKEKLSEMRLQIGDVTRKLQNSNIPGVPNFIWDMIETAHHNMTKVIHSLEQQPLDIAKVQHALSEAKVAVDHAVEQTELVLDQSYLTEQVIQYANRYRSRYPLLAAQLAESERLFRAFEYELALEHAAKAIEEIEPGALKRIEENQRSIELI